MKGPWKLPPANPPENSGAAGCRCPGGRDPCAVLRRARGGRGVGDEGPPWKT